MTVVLVINSGSSSFKYQLIDVETESALVSGLVERIGERRWRLVIPWPANESNLDLIELVPAAR